MACLETLSPDSGSLPLPPTIITLDRHVSKGCSRGSRHQQQGDEWSHWAWKRRISRDDDQRKGANLVLTITMALTEAKSSGIGVARHA